MLDQIASPEVQRYIREHEHADEKLLLLKHKEILGLPAAVLADQIHGRRKAKEKLPLFYNTKGVVYPKGLNLEQSSSEKTAEFKCEIIAGETDIRRDTCVDLTGGLGVDALFLAKFFKKVTYVDPDNDLLQIAKHNHLLLGAENIDYRKSTAESFLERTTEQFDLVYIDPSRRDNAHKKVFKFSDCEPDVSVLAKTIFTRTNHLLVKTSPLLDIQTGVSEIPFVKAVHIVSVNNECKEVLFLSDQSNLAEPIIYAINIHHNDQQTFTFSREEELHGKVSYSEPFAYMYEPNASILKAGAFKLVGLKFGLHKIHPNTHLYTSENLNPDFPGRIFKIEGQLNSSIKSIESFFPERLANAITRNYPLSAASLKKKFRIKDGGEKFLLAFTSYKKKYLLAASRIK